MHGRCNDDKRVQCRVRAYNCSASEATAKGKEMLRVTHKGDLELLLKRHHDLNGVQGVSAQVDELGAGLDLRQRQ